MGGLELLIDERGFLQCRGRGRRGLLTVPGLWWAGAMGPDTHFSPPPSGFLQGVRGCCVVVHPLGVRWSIGITVLAYQAAPLGLWMISPKFVSADVL